MTTKRINMHEENMLVRHEALDQLITYLVNDGYDVVGVSRESNKTAEEQPLANARYSVRTGSHNGLKSIISRCSPEFFRLRFGIGRPENREDVADYVLEKFSETTDEVDALINESVEAILNEVQ